MAQWKGQYSGNTHATKARELEAALRHAVAAFQAAMSPEEREKLAGPVRRLAKRVLSARLHVVTSRRAAARPDTPEDRLKSLRQRQEKMHDGGLNGILAEFGATSVIEVDTEAPNI